MARTDCDIAPLSNVLTTHLKEQLRSKEECAHEAWKSSVVRGRAADVLADHVRQRATEFAIRKFAIRKWPEPPEFIINQRSIVAGFAKYDWTERPVFATFKRSVRPAEFAIQRSELAAAFAKYQRTEWTVFATVKRSI